MELLYKRIRGTQDVLPKDSYKWKFIENVMLEEASLYGFKEIRTPVFEQTELFDRSVGEGTDVVEKEMYTFEDKGKRSLTLRPEGTAGVVRAILENGLYNESLPLKVSYILSCYRYEKPQAGRLREFHQFGLEIFGTNSPAADAELISIADSLFRRLGIRELSLEVNSIGCPVCREAYYKELKQYFEVHKNELCETCIDRLNKNPMRIFDCKSPECSEVAKNAPTMLEYICKDCANHFETLKDYLTELGIDYSVNPHIVRGLDYYTKTVFEFVSGDVGTQGTVCGGGRYDGLTKQLGGPSIPSLGFGLGLERLLMILDNQNIQIPKPETCDLYIGNMGDKSKLAAIKLTKAVRESSLIAECDIVGRSLKAQMKYADKIGAKFSLIIGSEELDSGVAKVKNMQTGEQLNVSIKDDFIDSFLSVYFAQTADELSF